MRRKSYSVSCVTIVESVTFFNPISKKFTQTMHADNPVALLRAQKARKQSLVFLGVVWISKFVSQKSDKITKGDGELELHLRKEVLQNYKKINEKAHDIVNIRSYSLTDPALHTGDGPSMC